MIASVRLAFRAFEEDSNLGTFTSGSEQKSTTEDYAKESNQGNASNGWSRHPRQPDYRRPTAYGMNL